MTTSNGDIPQGVVQVNELVSIDGVITLPEVIHCAVTQESCVSLWWCVSFAMTCATTQHVLVGQTCLDLKYHLTEGVCNFIRAGYLRDLFEDILVLL